MRMYLNGIIDELKEGYIHLDGIVATLQKEFDIDYDESETGSEGKSWGGRLKGLSIYVDDDCDELPFTQSPSMGQEIYLNGQLNLLKKVKKWEFVISGGTLKNLEVEIDDDGIIYKIPSNKIIIEDGGN